MINIEFKYYTPLQAEMTTFQERSSLLEKTADNHLKMKYNYIKITDDTCGFTQN